MKLIPKILISLLWVAGASAQAATIEMQVNGLVCPYCAQGIEEAAAKVPGHR